MTPILKAGMVGLDTSHCKAFIEVLHDPANPNHIPGIQVTGVYRGGSDQFGFSRERLDEFASEIDRRFQIPVYESIPQLVKDSDVLFLTSVDGRQHLEQFRLMAVGKPVYIDKPFATSSADAAAIAELAAKTGTPVMSCSSLRFASGIVEIKQLGEEILACEAYGPAPILPDYPGYFWYGIHSVEILYTLLGGGCQTVRTVATDKMDVITGAWPDGRTGVVLGTRFEGYEFGCLVHTRSGARLGVAKNDPPYYALLAKEIAGFFQSGQSPVDIQETLEITAFLEAAEQSKIQNGALAAISPLPGQA